MLKKIIEKFIIKINVWKMARIQKKLDRWVKKTYGFNTYAEWYNDREL